MLFQTGLDAVTRVDCPTSEFSQPDYAVALMKQLPFCTASKLDLSNACSAHNMRMTHS